MGRCVESQVDRLSVSIFTIETINNTQTQVSDAVASSPFENRQMTNSEKKDDRRHISAKNIFRFCHFNLMSV